MNDNVLKFRLFRDTEYFIITKQKVATRYLGSAFKTEGHEVTVDPKTLKISHIDLLGASKKTEDAIRKDWEQIVEGTYPGTVLILFRDPKKRFVSAQVQDFSDVIETVNENRITDFAFTSYFIRRFTQDTNFLDRLYKNVDSGDFDNIVLNSDGTYNIVAYNILKDMLYDWIIYRHNKNTLNGLHSEHYLYAAKYITEISSKCENLLLLNIDDPTVDLKNVLTKWVNVDKIKNSDKKEGRELKKIFADLVKENTTIQRLVESNLQNEFFCYNLLKSHKKAIKNNITI